MALFQRALQAALRWRMLSLAMQRQRAVLDRAVRMYSHRVVAGTQRRVLQVGWGCQPVAARESAQVGCLLHQNFRETDGAVGKGGSQAPDFWALASGPRRRGLL